MNRITTLLLATLSTLPLAAQGHKFQINTQTPEGQLLQQAGQEADEAKKLALYEEYLAKYPKHEGVVYAWGQAQPLLLKAKNLDKVITAAEAILAGDPDNAPAAYNALQAAEQKKDVPAIIHWSNRTVEAARKALATTKPADDEDAETWTHNVDFAKQVIARCEYSFYASALQVTEPAQIAALYEALEAMNPRSQYVPMAGPRYFVALLQAKQFDKAMAYATKAIDANQANEDVLLFAADTSLTGSKDFGKAAAYAERITSTLPSQPAPQGMSAADWDARKKSTLGRAWWIAGVAHGSLKEWANSEKAMKEALPLVQGNPAQKDLLPGTLFYLGLANYSMARTGAKVDAARYNEARKYFTQCAAIPSPFQGQAQKNLAAIAAGK